MIILMMVIMFSLALGIFTYFQNKTFVETFYHVQSAKVDHPVRFALLSDLHSQEYGTDNSVLVERIRALSPDVIICAGDMINDTGDNIKSIIPLMTQLVEIAPTYYSFGNNENELVFLHDMELQYLNIAYGATTDDKERFELHCYDPALIDELENIGVTVLINTLASLEIRGNAIEIMGVNTTLQSFWDYSGQNSWLFTPESDVLKILVAHRPELFLEYLEGTDIDLGMSGHTHGGLIQLPYLGGLYAHDQGLFPELDKGDFSERDPELIISGGLGNHGVIPRINNPPELVLIDIDKY